MARPAAAAAATPARRFSALQHRDFRILWLGMVFSGSTFVFQYYAQAWFIVQATDSPIALGILGGGRGLLMALLSVYGGVLADRMDRRKLLIFTQSTAMAVYAVLSVLVILDRAPLWLAFLLMFTSAAALAVDMPVRQALAPELVPRQDIPNAMALVMAAQMGAFAYLPPLAGLAIDHFGPGWAFAISLWGHAGIIVAVLMLKGGRRPARSGISTSNWSDLREGFAFARQQRTIFWVLAVTWVTSGLGFPLISTLAPLWMKGVLGLSATGFTVISSFWGTASLVSSVYLAQRRDMPMLGPIFVGAAFVFSGSLLLFAFTRALPLVATAWFINGLAFSASNIAMSAVVQLKAPNEVRGRIMGLVTVSRSLSQLSAFPLSLVAAAIGMTGMFPLAAMSTAVLVVGMTALSPTLRAMARQRGMPDEA